MEENSTNGKGKRPLQGSREVTVRSKDRSWWMGGFKGERREEWREAACSLATKVCPSLSAR